MHMIFKLMTFAILTATTACAPTPTTPKVQPTSSDAKTANDVPVTDDSDEIATSEVTPDGNGVYPYRPGGYISEPILIKRGEFDPRQYYGDRGLPGPLVAEAVIEIDGTIGDVVLVRGLGGEVDAAFVKAVKQYLFEPATLKGEPVAVKYVLVVRSHPQP